METKEGILEHLDTFMREIGAGAAPRPTGDSPYLLSEGDIERLSENQLGTLLNKYGAWHEYLTSRLELEESYKAGLKDEYDTVMAKAELDHRSETPARARDSIIRLQPEVTKMREALSKLEGRISVLKRELRRVAKSIDVLDRQTRLRAGGRYKQRRIPNAVFPDGSRPLLRENGNE